MKINDSIRYILLAWAIGGSAMGWSATRITTEDSIALEAQLALAQDSIEAFPSWKEVFVDSNLRVLIEQGLAHNTDLNVARLRIDQAEASFKAARLANLPSLAFSPQAGISSFGGSQAVKTYSLPLQASWQVDLFGKLKNAKMQQKMLLENSKAYQQAVEVQVIASIAREYYQMQSLREQLDLAHQSIGIWDETVRAMKAFMEEGQYTDAAVSGAEASREAVKATALDLEQQIRENENAIRLLIGENTWKEINSKEVFPSEKLSFEKALAKKVSNLSNQTKGTISPLSSSINLNISEGIALNRLSSRPDVRQAEMNLVASTYATKEAKASFYPSLTLSGSAGWTNSSGIITNPGKILLEAIASLTQPIFQNGRLKAELAIRKSQQEEARLQFQQTLLNAGVEANNALTQVQTYSDKTLLLDNQVKALERTVKSTRLLQENGSSNYLEVLTAQENLLSAKMAALQNEYLKTASLIALYQAIL